MTEIIHGRYEVVRPLGMGATCIVVEARDLHDARHVALKMLRPIDRLQQSAVERFRREAQTMASLRDPHIVELLGYFEDPPVLVLELLHGETVRAALRREGALPLPRACTIGVQVAAALQAAHAEGAVHRDVKPSNIFLTEPAAQQPGLASPRAKLIDFGVAKRADAEGPPLTSASAVIGSALYMSPEQIGGEPVHARSDTYALGLCVYEMVTGQQPHLGSNLHQAMLRVLAGEPLPAHAALPAGLHAVLLRATSLAPERRYQSAADLGRALAAFAHVETPRTQLSAAILARSSGAPGSEPRPSSTASKRPPTAPMLQGTRPPAFEPPSPASMTAPLTTLSEQRAQARLAQPAQPPAMHAPQRAPMPHDPPERAPGRRAAAEWASTTRSAGSLAPLAPTPAAGAALAGTTLPAYWLLGGAAAIALGGLGAAAFVLWSARPSAAPRAETVTLDAATLDAALPAAMSSEAPAAPVPALLPATEQAQPLPKTTPPAARGRRPQDPGDLGIPSIR